MNSAPPGYKHTEVGIIPIDWDTKSVRELAPLQRGFDLPTTQLRPGSHPVVYSNGVLQYHYQAPVKGPGVVTGRSGTIGKVHFLDTDYWPHNTTLWVTSFCGNEPMFIYYLYTHVDFTRFLSGSGVPTLNRNDVHQYIVPCPPPVEQRAIAEALSDVDGLLGVLEKVIVKKRAIKQGTMQQLLTGRTRFPGFSGHWEMKRVGDLLTRIVGGGTPSRSNPVFWGDDIPWVTVKDFASFDPRKTQESITKYGLDNSATHLITAGTLITSTRMALGKAVIYDIDVCINQDLKALFCQSSLSTQYLYYWFEHHADLIEELGSGSTVKGLAVADLKAISFALPSLPEQNAIAIALSDMDDEIVALERRKEKIRAIKQGMMQQLLTGKVRLVKPEVAT